MSLFVVSTRRRLRLAESCGTSHQSGDPFAGDASSLIAQFPVDARTPISALMSGKDLLNFFGELSIFSFALADRTLEPGIIATF